MSDYVTFEGVIVPMLWGETTYTVLPLPEEVLAALGKARRVEGEFADHPVNLAVTRAPVLDTAFLYAGQSLLDRTGLQPGEPFEVRLRAADPTRVEVPRDVMLALRSSGQLDAWETLTPGARRGHLHKIESAKRAETRDKRISALLAILAAP